MASDTGQPSEEARLNDLVTKLDGELRGERQVIELLSAENASKHDEIAEYEAELAAELERHGEDMKLLEHERISIAKHLEHEVEAVSQQVSHLAATYETMQSTMRENESLSKTKEGLVKQRESEGMRHALELHRMKQESVELRQQIENTFRKALLEIDKTVHIKAFDALDKEAKNSLLANAKLKEELAMQEKGEKNIAQRHAYQEEEMTQLQLEMEKLNSSVSERHREVALIKRQLAEFEAQMADLELTLARLERERAGREQATKEHPPLSALKLQVQQAEARLLQAARHKGKWEDRARAVQRLVEREEFDDQFALPAASPQSAPDSSEGLVAPPDIRTLLAAWEQEDRDDGEEPLSLRPSKTPVEARVAQRHRCFRQQATWSHPPPPPSTTTPSEAIPSDGTAGSSLRQWSSSQPSAPSIAVREDGVHLAVAADYGRVTSSIADELRAVMDEEQATPGTFELRRRRPPPKLQPRLTKTQLRASDKKVEGVKAIKQKAGVPAALLVSQDKAMKLLKTMESSPGYQMGRQIKMAEGHRRGGLVKTRPKR